MNSITVETYVSLHCERKELVAIAPIQTGEEQIATVSRIREIDAQLKEADAVLPRLSTSNTCFKYNIMQEIEINAIYTDLIIKSWWASWLPFGWMHNLAASYYTGKARRIYNERKQSVR